MRKRAFAFFTRRSANPQVARRHTQVRMRYPGRGQAVSLAGCSISSHGELFFRSPALELSNSRTQNQCICSIRTTNIMPQGIAMRSKACPLKPSFCHWRQGSFSICSCRRATCPTIAKCSCGACICSCDTAEAGFGRLANVRDMT